MKSIEKKKPGFQPKPKFKKVIIAGSNKPRYINPDKIRFLDVANEQSVITLDGGEYIEVKHTIEELQEILR